jgi:hypothetical protein
MTKSSRLPLKTVYEIPAPAVVNNWMPAAAPYKNKVEPKSVYCTTPPLPVPAGVNGSDTIVAIPAFV